MHRRRAGACERGERDRRRPGAHPAQGRHGARGKGRAPRLRYGSRPRSSDQAWLELRALRVGLRRDRRTAERPEDARLDRHRRHERALRARWRQAPSMRPASRDPERILAYCHTRLATRRWRGGRPPSDRRGLLRRPRADERHARRSAGEGSGERDDAVVAVIRGTAVPVGEGSLTRKARHYRCGARKWPKSSSAACRPVGECGSDGAQNRPSGQSRQGSC